MTNLLYTTIADRLRDRITSGSISPSGALPTESELCVEYEVSRSTIRRALGLLRDEGWLDARQGSGWSVPVNRWGRQFGTFRLKVTSGEATGTTSRTVGHDRRRPPRSVARSLDTDRRRKLLVVERLTTADGTPIHRSETWFNPATSTALDPQRAATEPPARLLASLGHELGRLDQYAQAVLADQRDCELLDIGDGSAVLEVVRTAYSPSRSPLFQSRHRHPGTAVRLDIDFPTTDRSDGLVVGLHRPS